MPKIEQLTPQLANMIAAGEVVERPGSVVKELVENAIDAGATAVTVEIRRGGAAYMRITDDGCGIPMEEVRTAFLRHATSKIKKESDLLSIATLGFRGEALAAVSAVARVDMFTRPADCQLGTQICLEAGEETVFQETGCPKGTTIVVRDLFFNVPARMKFLKKDQTEAAYVEAAVVNAALSHPEVAFTFIKDGRESLSTPGDGKRTSVVRAAYGRDVAEQMIPASARLGEIQVDGLISKPSMTRASRSMQLFFINGRPVRSRLLGAALEEAYRGKVMTGRYPACILELTMSLSAVDVNVHPAKLEVKFAREKEVFGAIYNTVTSTLNQKNTLADAVPETVLQRPQITEDNLTDRQQRLEAPAAPVRTTASFTPRPSMPTAPESWAGASSKVAQNRAGYTAGSTEGDPKLYGSLMDSYRSSAETVTASEAPVYLVRQADLAAEAAPAAAPETPVQSAPEPAALPDLPAGKVLGECFDSFVVVEQGDDLWLLDKHAAHEKLLYNRLRENTGDPEGQLLLEPLSVRLSPEEKAVCLQHSDMLERAGFLAEDFGAAGLALRQIPTYLEQDDAPYVLSDIARRLLENRTPDLNEVYDDLLKSIACKAAIKAGSALSPEEMENVALMALTLPEVRNCPHGRPVAVRFTRYQIEKLFKRIV